MGKIGGSNGQYEVHALTKDLPFREYRSSQIADQALFNKLLEARYDLMEARRGITFIAANPDVGNRREYNPHDDRPGTVHFVCLDSKTGEIVCGLSVAVDIGDCDKGEPIGLPLENRWRRGIYEEGPSLDPFREKYLRLNFGYEGAIEPWQMAEYYRHFRCIGSPKGDILTRLAVYTANYHLLAREAGRNGNKPTHIWLFEAEPDYFNLYKLAGAAVLRDATIDNPPRHISPSKKDWEEVTANGKKAIKYKGELISRNMRTLARSVDEGKMDFQMEDTPVLDGLTNIAMIERAIKENPLDLAHVTYDGISKTDIDMLRTSLTLTCKRVYDEYHGDNEIINAWAQESRKLLAQEWDFNEIGE